MSKLTAGLIPAGTACPFLDNCKFKIHTCPGVDGKVRSGNFSCAAARLHDVIETSQADGFVAQAKAMVRKNPEHPAHTGEEIVIDDDEGYTD